MTSPTTLRFVRLKKFVCVLCGPLANAFMMVAALVIAKDKSSHDPATWLIWTFVASNAVVLAFNLWPRHILTDRKRVPSDGLALLTIPFWSKDKIKSLHALYFFLEGLESRERHKSGDAAIWFQRGLEEYPEQPWGYLGLYQLCHDQGRYADAREILVKALDSEPPSEFAPALWNYLAWTNLMIGGPVLVAEANRLSKQAFEQSGSVPQFKGTRGSALVECGEIDQGIKLLQAAFAEITLSSDKALYACYLAIAMAKRNDFAGAKQYLDHARKLDPKCPLIERAVRELEARSQPVPVVEPVD